MKIILKSRLIVVFLVTFIPFTVIAQDRLSIAEVKDGLHVITGPGGNIGVRVTAEGVILIDDKYPQDFDEIQSLVATVSDLPVKYVINTHHHGDHSGSNASFLQVADVIAHKNARDNMIRGDQDGPPRLIYTDQTSVFLGGAEVRAYYMGRGHTNGDSVILFPDMRTIHTGDLFIWGDRMDGSTMAPFIDYANGGCAGDWVATLDQVLALDFDTVIPGHGPLLRKAEVRIFRDKFEQLLSRIGSLMSNGVNREEIVSVLEISDLNWPLAPDRIREIYDELSR